MDQQSPPPEESRNLRDLVRTHGAGDQGEYEDGPESDLPPFQPEDYEKIKSRNEPWARLVASLTSSVATMQMAGAGLPGDLVKEAANQAYNTSFATLHEIYTVSDVATLIGYQLPPIVRGIIAIAGTGVVVVSSLGQSKTLVDEYLEKTGQGRPRGGTPAPETPAATGEGPGAS